MPSSSPNPGKEINQAISTLPAPISDKLPHVPETKEELKADIEEAGAKSLAGLRSLVAGGFGGVCAVIVGHPFDLVKVRLQTAERGVYKNAFDVVRKSVTKDGLGRGLYAGVSAPLVGVTPMFAVSFWGYDVGKGLVRRFSTVHDNQLSVAQVSAAGFFSAIPMTLITAPFERVKVLLQIQGQKTLAPGEKPKYSGGIDVVRQLYKEGGIRSVFRGSVATLARDGPGSAAYFATYEYIKRSLTPLDPVTGKPSGQLSLTAVMAAGGAAGVAMWIPVFPIDTVKSRLQTMEGKPTVGGVIGGLYRNGGFKAFFPGFGPALARAVPANAATFLGVELAHQFMNKTFEGFSEEGIASDQTFNANLPACKDVSDPRANHEVRIARVVWAAHILSYLTGESSHTKLLPDFDGGEDFDGDDLDAETEKEVVLSSSAGSIRSAFLDCVAELLSPSKGWDHVVTTGLRESEDFVEVDVARNDGVFNPEYLKDLQKYLSSAFEQGTDDQSTTSLSWFEILATEFHRERIDNWVAIARQCIASKPPSHDRSKKTSRRFQQAIKKWKNISALLRKQETGKDTLREEVVHAAYVCVISVDVHGLLQRSYGSEIGPKLWRALRFIARPVFNCRLLMRIASQLRNFRMVKIFPILPGPKTKLNKKYLVAITDAWVQLASIPPPAPELQKVAAYASRFKQDCAKSFGSHAEIQLSLHYENSVSLTPSIDYFGCSKKVCLLCEGFLESLPHPISTRGRHGICYPSWGVPISKSDDIGNTLHELEKTLVSRIEQYLKGNYGWKFLNQVPQSTIVPDFSSSSLEEISQRKEIIRSIEENREVLQRERRILDGQSSKSQPAKPSKAIIEPSDSCVMCNNTPAKLCARCKNCYYCSRECQETDWPCHKLLCKDLLTQFPRPSPEHKRAILFPENSTKPTLTWILCTRKASSEYEEYGIVKEYETADVRPLLGPDNTWVATRSIQRNPKRNRNLGVAFWYARKEGYSLIINFRDNFLEDGSSINRSILESVKTSGTVHHRWSGPIIAMRENCNEFYEDITLGDFRHVIDYFVSYNNSEVRETSNPQPRTPTATDIRGVKICCFGETKLHGSESYVPVEISEIHPILSRVFNSKDDISPLSKYLGTPLRLWKFPDIEMWVDPPGWNESMGADSNPDVANLMRDLNPKSKSWGWAPMYWDLDIGNVLIVRADGKELGVEEVRLLCYFAKSKLLPLIEDALGSGDVRRTRKEVMDFITKDNLERCRAEMKRDLIGS